MLTSVDGAETCFLKRSNLGGAIFLTISLFSSYISTDEGTGWFLLFVVFVVVCVGSFFLYHLKLYVG